ncbi:bifunctional adenosylcobinamide kinase/adenosylcobinamide-phosphate guanylyltransferase [Aliiruegeria sabulilitoris]|uniref:bifunctional adenosylcobinamide kinase/adenosylcobinamide-phosphate guanylyltransferase n=1 Tax=Aliiruegeria sabulilitoris TaxID=1510458 RepID=UPI00082D69D9|nr:bifunctional adenosylcobinamide kinase/adenosylcobinamide-phosphate guanylyltransferase [Aliiruegeria sabulilitoris]NDR55919.1 bifunctional adenosylcobinamide kinase/adenosylcobinamide-phosphate guanylyltransferase [Pseudoruegeria sp. M32A2M]
MTSQITLVLGGASSGKSAFAEGLARSTGFKRIYLATSQAFDAEMAAKIAAHRQMRGAGWDTVEAPHELAETLSGQPSGHIILLDCATMWLSNRLLAEVDPETEFDALIAALESCASPVVVVSNEVGQGIVPDTPLSRRFRDLQGRLNRQIAAKAGLVVAVMAGLPLTLKGTLPEDMTW